MTPNGFVWAHMGPRARAGPLAHRDRAHFALWESPALEAVDVETVEVASATFMLLKKVLPTRKWLQAVSVPYS